MNDDGGGYCHFQNETWHEEPMFNWHRPETQKHSHIPIHTLALTRHYRNSICTNASEHSETNGEISTIVHIERLRGGWVKTAKANRIEQSNTWYYQGSARSNCISSGCKLKSFSMRFFSVCSRIYFIHCHSLLRLLLLSIHKETDWTGTEERLEPITFTAI